MKNALPTQLLILLSISVSTTAQLQKKDSSSYVQPQIQVTALRASDKSPFTTTNISQQQLAANNVGYDIPTLLNQTPATVISSDAGNGIGYTGIRIRGTDASRINMTINGVPYNDAESQGIFFVNLPDLASSTSSLQIQRGVGSSTNGTAAFGASLNFSTLQAQPTKQLQFSKSHGSFNTYKHSLVAATGLTNSGLSASIRLSQLHSNGYVQRAKTNLLGGLLNIGYNHNKLNLQFNIISGSEKTNQAWYGVNKNMLKTNRRYNSAGTEKTDEPYKNETDNYLQTQYQLIANYKANAYWQLSNTAFYTRGKGYYEQYKAAQDYATYNLPYPNTTSTQTDLVRQLWLSNHYYGISSNAMYNKGANQVVLGGLISTYQGSHYGIIKWAQLGINTPYIWYNIPATKSDITLYSKWLHSLTPNITLYSDVQYRGVNYNIYGFRNNPNLKLNNTYSFFNPKVGISYSKNNTTASISYAIANKEPNRDDFENTITDQPQPEQLHDIELNYTKLINKLQLNATGYYMYYHNQLILNGRLNDVGAFTRQNVPISYRTGIELQANYAFTKKLYATGNISLSHNKIKNYTEYIPNYDAGGNITKQYSNTNIALSPATVAAASLSYKATQQLSVLTQAKYVGLQYLDNTQNNARSLAPFYIQDVHITYHPKLKKIKNFTLQGQVNNVLNRLYEPNGYTYSYIIGGNTTTDNYYYPMAGINYMVAITVGL